MRRTSATPLVILAVVGAAAGYLVEQALTVAGSALLVPPWTLTATLLVIAGLVLGFAIPVRRAVTGRSTKPVDPFRTTRVVALAKTCSLCGALLVGLALGALAFMLTRTVWSSVGASVLTGILALGAAVTLTAGLVAEHLCRLPKDDDDDTEPDDS